MTKHILTGFGFGPIQSGLFVAEAFKSGNFSRIVIAEIDQNIVDAIIANNGSYYINVARFDGIEAVKIDGIEVFNPSNKDDREKLLEVLAQSTEIVTSLPSVKFYDIGEYSVASLIAQGLKNSRANATIIYTAENNNHAAEILEEEVNIKPSHPVQYLNTVRGKMSQVVTDADEIKEKNLKQMAPGIDRAFLVEEFNKILITKCDIENFTPGIEVLAEKEDLLPFEEAKLYGHNAIHATLAYLGAFRGHAKMNQLKDDKAIMQIARDAFISESGTALIKKYVNFGDELFTEAGYKAFAEDLLERMTNPCLDDPIKRAARDPIRKLGINDRIFGTMALCLEQGIEPVNMALGAMAGIVFLLRGADENNLPQNLRFDNWHNLTDSNIEKVLRWIWSDADSEYSNRIISCVQKAKAYLMNLPDDAARTAQSFSLK